MKQKSDVFEQQAPGDDCWLHACLSGFAEEPSYSAGLRQIVTVFALLFSRFKFIHQAATCVKLLLLAVAPVWPW